MHLKEELLLLFHALRLYISESTYALRAAFCAVKMQTLRVIGGLASWCCAVEVRIAA